MVKGLGEIAVFKSYTFPLSLTSSFIFSQSTTLFTLLLLLNLNDSTPCKLDDSQQQALHYLYHQMKMRRVFLRENKNTQINPFHSLNCKSMKDSQICKQTKYNTRCNLHRYCWSFIKTFPITLFKYKCLKLNSINCY